MEPRDDSSPGPVGRRRARAGEDPVRLSESLAALSGRLGVGSAHAVAAVFGHWEAIVGPAIAMHVHPLKIEGDTLFVATDHPAWATQLRYLAPQILERVSQACKEGEAPERLEVRVAR
jgi:predicted nucleic acid-binding Zn ribbon protein